MKRQQGAGLILVLTLSCALLPVATAQVEEIDSVLNESVQMVAKQGLFSIQIETTFYKPDGAGPFPVVIINHGKARGDTRFQGRYRPANAARYFMLRGYAVVVPMRQGFSKSGGSYIGGECNVESNGRVQADDVKAVLDHVAVQGWADMNNIVVLGQSHGGWTTLAFGTQGYPGVKALINFAGGLRQENCVAWENGLARAAAAYGRETRIPSLWFYGDNDSYFNTATYRAMFDQYSAAGGPARLLAFGSFGSDSHSMFGSRAGAPIWQPEVSKFLATAGLPSALKAGYSKYAAAALTELPPRTDFAALEDETRLPHVRDTGRAGYKAYLAKEFPRAFAIAPSGAWGWATAGDDPLRRALDNCNRNRKDKADCRLYSVDDMVVWKPDP
ncbi:MAG: dienelactone hydrolase family protein [Rhodoferax sp.]